MKKQALLLLLILNNLNCDNTDFKTELLQFKTALAQVTKDCTEAQDDPALLVAGILIRIVNEMPLEQIKPTIIQWHNENPNIFNGTVKLTEIHPPFFCYLFGGEYEKLVNNANEAYEKLSQLMPKASYLDLFISSANRESETEILNALKEIGVPRRLSDKELDLFVQLQQTSIRPNFETVKKRVHLIESLIDIYQK